MHWIHAQVVTFSCQIYGSRWSQYAASEGREPFPHDKDYHSRRHKSSYADKRLKYLIMCAESRLIL